MSNATEIERQVVEVIRRQLNVHGRSLHAPTRFVDDLGADSLAVLELTVVFEEAFGIDIPDHEANAIRTVRDAVTTVERHVRMRGRGEREQAD